MTLFSATATLLFLTTTLPTATAVEVADDDFMAGPLDPTEFFLPESTDSSPSVRVNCNYGDAYADAYGVGVNRKVKTSVPGRTSGGAYDEYGHTHAETHGWAGTGSALAVAGSKKVDC